MRSRVVGNAVSLVVALVVVEAVAGCVADGPEGTTGAKGKVVFQSETNLVFTSPVALGSTFRVTFVEKDEDAGVDKDAELVVADGEGDGDATVVAAEEGDGFDVTLTASGKVTLGVANPGDGSVIDTIVVDVRAIGDSALVDALVLASIDIVDARLPQHVAIVADEPTRFLISAVDTCLAGVLDLGASSLVVVADEGVDPATIATVTDEGLAGFVVEPLQSGTFFLELQSGDLAPLQYELDVVARGDVDEVHADVASVDSQAGTARLWGRGFVDDVDVVGLTFGWSADPRVALAANSGAAVDATISFPTDGTVDDRPAVVTAEVFGTEGAVDLLALVAGDIVVARGGVPERPAGEDDKETEEATDEGCAGAGGAGTCTAAFSLLLLRRRRLLRA